jgi:hypothetical protein
LTDEEQVKRDLIKVNVIKDFLNVEINFKMKSEPSSGGISRQNRNTHKQTNESLLIGQIKSK